mgnify:CR=1 FL=1
MREILLTSSVLILAVLLLRRAFRDRISRRAQYVLWALLVPVSLPGADFSVLSAAEPVGRTVTERLEQREIYRVPLAPSPMGTAPQVTSPAPQIEGGGSPSGEAAAPSGGEEAFSYPGGDGGGPADGPLADRHRRHGGVVSGDQPALLAKAPEDEGALCRGELQVSRLSGGGRSPLPLPVRAVPARHLSYPRRCHLSGAAAACAGP